MPLSITQMLQWVVMFTLAKPVIELSRLLLSFGIIFLFNLLLVWVEDFVVDDGSKGWGLVTETGMVVPGSSIFISPRCKPGAGLRRFGC